MARKDVKNIDIVPGFEKKNGVDWQKENNVDTVWKTPEHIDVKPVYTKDDL